MMIAGDVNHGKIGTVKFLSNQQLWRPDSAQAGNCLIELICRNETNVELD